MSVEKITRNEDIFKKHLSGKTFSELANEYGLSRIRITQIVQHEQELELYKSNIDIPEIRQACLRLSSAEGMYNRIVNALLSKHFVKNNKWKTLSRRQMLRIRNIGEKGADILEYAQQIAR